MAMLTPGLGATSPAHHPALMEGFCSLVFNVLDLHHCRVQCGSHLCIDDDEGDPGLCMVAALFHMQVSDALEHKIWVLQLPNSFQQCLDIGPVVGPNILLGQLSQQGKVEVRDG